MLPTVVWFKMVHFCVRVCLLSTCFMLMYFQIIHRSTFNSSPQKNLCLFDIPQTNRKNPLLCQPCWYKLKFFWYSCVKYKYINSHSIILQCCRQRFWMNTVKYMFNIFWFQIIYTPLSTYLLYWEKYIYPSIERKRKKIRGKKIISRIKN